MQNIHYLTPEIERFYREHRTRWTEFYESERVVLERIGLGPGSSALDVGCGCGGLGLALRERFGITDYTGIEINAQAARTASALNPDARVVHGDILTLPDSALGARKFDVVISFGCIDWNVRFADMLRAAYSFVRPGGFFVSSFRLTAEATVNDIARSHQYINFAGEKKGERACYVVSNAGELCRDLKALAPARITGYGYWGTPSATAVTPFEKICFAVLALQRGTAGSGANTAIELDLPPEIMACIDRG